MSSGIYKMVFRGAVDWGMGLLMLQNGQITGADVGGVTYDGKYTDRGDNIEFDAVLKVPAGVPLVQGIPAKPVPYEVPFKTNINKQAVETGQAVLINLPIGPVNVIFQCLRKI